MDLSSAAALTAIASFIAATIGAIAAVTVACINRASARQIAIDDAHREYRREWARSTIQASRHHFGVLQAMAIRAYNNDFDACVQLAREERGPRVVKTDLRKPDDDPVFAEALEAFVFRRSKCDWHLFPPNVFANAAALEPDGAMWMCVDLSEYMSEVVRALEVAAEAYEFNLDPTRKRAAETLKPIDNKLELDTYLLSAREARVRARGEQQAGM